MTFFDRVKELVKFKNRTIKSFIEELGLNYGSYNTLRKSHNLPRGDECVKIANALGTTVEYLVTGQEREVANKRQELKNLLLQAIDKVDEL